MIRREVLKLGALAGLALLPGFAHATGYKAKEKRWAEQILSTLLIGHGVWLEAKTGPFFSIYTESVTDKPKGGVILLHDAGLHPDWPEVIFPLRSQLPELGWSSLSLQTPILPLGAPFPAYGPILDESPERINAGLRFLRDQDIEHIVLVGHGIGASLGAAFLAQTGKDSGVKGFVGIALDAPVANSTIYTFDPRLYTPNTLAKITLPVFDIYGGLDVKTTTESAPLRVAAGKQAGNSHYRQQRFPEAGHAFLGQEDALVKAIAQWLDKNLAQAS